MTAASLLLRNALLLDPAEGGYVEGENLIIEFRWAHGHYERVPALANDLRSGPIKSFERTALS